MKKCKTTELTNTTSSVGIKDIICILATINNECRQTDKQLPAIKENNKILFPYITIDNFLQLRTLTKKLYYNIGSLEDDINSYDEYDDIEIEKYKNLEGLNKDIEIKLFDDYINSKIIKTESNKEVANYKKLSIDEKSILLLGNIKNSRDDYKQNIFRYIFECETNIRNSLLYKGIIECGEEPFSFSHRENGDEMYFMEFKKIHTTASCNVYYNRSIYIKLIGLDDCDEWEIAEVTDNGVIINECEFNNEIEEILKSINDTLYRVSQFGNIAMDYKQKRDIKIYEYIKNEKNKKRENIINNICYGIIGNRVIDDNGKQNINNKNISDEIQKSLNLLNLKHTTKLTQKKVKEISKDLLLKFHPDRNNNSEESNSMTIKIIKSRETIIQFLKDKRKGR